MIWTKRFWKAVLDRAVRTAAQAVIATITGTSINLVDWTAGGYFIATMVVLSVCNSILRPPAEAKENQ